MIRGYCIGGGVAVAICCDLRICTKESSFGIPAAKLGLGYAFDKVRQLSDVVGPAFTKEIFFSGKRFTAEEAADMGLVNRVVSDNELEGFVREYAETIAGNAPLTVASIKKIVNEIVKDPDDRDIATCDAMVKACFDSQDYIEGRRAFMEKRKPSFTGK
jgi:enoyl-CoA hydratase/carnithine racemase